MSVRWPGSIISSLSPGVSGQTVSSTGLVTSTGNASGVWTVDQANYYNANSIWPKASTGMLPLYSWGWNSYGQLGLGNQINRSSPTQVGLLTNWATTSLGNFSLVIKTDGTLWAWGANPFGNLGLGNVIYRSSPTQVGALTDWFKISTSLNHTLATKTNGTLWAWGYNPYGNLGLGDVVYRSSPVQVGTNTYWSSISAGQYFSLATKTDGTLWVWGHNGYGSLGLGDINYRSSPVQIGALTDWLSMSAGAYYSLAIKTNGTLWSWGKNNFGTLGLGDKIYRSSPVQVGLLTNWSSISAASVEAGSIKTDGTLWTWGRNDYGQLGLGDKIYRSSPVQVGALTNWSKIICNDSAAAATKTDGTLWTWGLNNNGQLGLGNIIYRSSPVQVGALTNWISISGNRSAFLGIAGFNSFYPTTFTQPTNGVVSTTGIYSLWVSTNPNTYGQLGQNNTTGTNSPVQVGTDTTSWSSVANGYTNFSAIKTNGTLWSWGRNNTGQLGLGDVISRSSPVQVGALTDWLSISGLYSMNALKTNGTLWSWGRNNYGQLGLGDVVYRSSPVQVGALTNWSSFASTDYSTTAIKTDGTLWAWGVNSYSGFGDNISRSSPVQIGALTNWASLASTSTVGLALKTDTTLWGWGSPGVYGLLGINSNISRSSPIQIGNDWTMISPGINRTIAINTLGQLWTWGNNNYGQLGLGDKIYRSSPVQVGTDTNWIAIMYGCGDGSTQHSGGIRSNISALSGTLWGWGSNGNGQLGLNDTIYRSSPVQVGALTNWVSIVGGYRNSYAIKTDNSLWVLGGQGFGGNLGTQTSIDRSSPVQIAGSWTAVFSQGYTNLGVKTDGTLWSWGRNSFGELGLGDKIYRSSPTQIGALTNWASVDRTVSLFTPAPFGCGPSYASAIKSNGTLWTWGNNGTGVLGLGDVIARSSPVQVGTDTNWSKLYTGGNQNNISIKTDGTLWTWGQNIYGVLGLNDTSVSRSSPTQVGTDTNWLSACAGYRYAIALKTNKTFWAWGTNSAGQLGTGLSGLAGYRSSPVQVGPPVYWSFIGSGNDNVLSIAIDGTLWAWGINGSGQLGTGDTIDKLSPVQIGILTNWASVNGGNFHSAAIKTDGSLWSWGTAGYNATPTNTSSPVQLGTNTNWFKVLHGASTFAALQKVPIRNL